MKSSTKDRSDQTERKKCWHAQCGGEHKDRAVGEIMAYDSHYGSRNSVAKREKTCVAPEPDTQQGIADEAEANGGHCRTDEAACDSMQQLGDNNRAEAGPSGE
jgi:hypothetical protein